MHKDPAPARRAHKPAAKATPRPAPRHANGGLHPLQVEMAKAEATLALAKSGEKIAEALEQLVPAAEAIHALGLAQQRLCSFLVGNRLKLAASVPAVIIMVQGISPNAAKLLANLLRAWGVSP